MTKMQNQETDEIVVDARGHRCPVPTLRLRRAVEAAPPGSVVRLLADDPLARIDVPHFAAQAGLEVLEFQVDGPVLDIRVLTPETGKRRAGGGKRRAARGCSTLLIDANRNEGRGCAATSTI